MINDVLIKNTVINALLETTDTTFHDDDDDTTSTPNITTDSRLLSLITDHALVSTEEFPVITFHNNLVTMHIFTMKKRPRIYRLQGDRHFS